MGWTPTVRTDLGWSSSCWVSLSCFRARRNRPEGCQPGRQNWAEAGALAISNQPPVSTDATWRGV